MVLDINPGPDSSNPQYFTPFNGNYLIFSADDGTHGYELWAVDDADYTYLWRDLRTGSTSSYPTDLAATNGAYLYFSAIGNHGVYGKELYMCPDVGSGSACDIHSDIYSGSSSSSPDNLIVVNGNLYFFAWDGEQRELWICDVGSGGACSPQMIDINPFGSSNHRNSNAYMIEYDDELYFTAQVGIDTGSDLLRFDGSTITTVDTNDASNPIVYNGELYYWEYTNQRSHLMVTGGTLLDYTVVTYS